MSGKTNCDISQFFFYLSEVTKKIYFVTGEHCNKTSHPMGLESQINNLQV